MIERIGNFCRAFRKEVLHKTLKEIATENHVNSKSISAFENGRANNIKYLSIYLHSCNDEQREIFLKGVFKCL